ncbi:16955_t:CDS:2, partial [Racocetra persica]
IIAHSDNLHEDKYYVLLKEWQMIYMNEKKAEERHLYLSTEIVTPATFECYQGFDLANFDNQQYPRSEVPQFKVLKSETCGTFKAIIAQKVGISSKKLALNIEPTIHHWRPAV